MTDDEPLSEAMRGSIGVIVLAAGLSQRMGKVKMLLPWGNTTVIGQVITTLLSVKLKEIDVVCGGTRPLIEEALQGFPVNIFTNPDYQNGEMLRSLQVGIGSLKRSILAALIVLGDQPQIQATTIVNVISEYFQTGNKIVVPSYQMRRGHPWLIDRGLWGQIEALKSNQTMRDFLKDHQQLIHYFPVDNPSILQDLDTPEDYERYKPTN